MKEFTLERTCAEKMDSEDKLASFQERFYKLKDTIYMDGNSLGLCSKDAEKYLMEALDAWKTGAIAVWEQYGYFLYQDKLGKLCAPLINADEDEVTICGSTTLNIHQAVATFYKPTPKKNKIIMDNLNFPTDRYAVYSNKGYT